MSKQNEIDRAKAIAAYNSGILSRKIVIEADADFTPKGKRRVRVVFHKVSGEKCSPRLRWYVGRAVYRDLPITLENQKMSDHWIAAE